MTYIVWDESGHRETIEADTAEEAAQEYVDTGDWSESDRTVFHNLWTDDGSEVEMHTITVDPPAPKCTRRAHDWREVDVRGNGGGVLVTECCRHCGTELVTDTWAHNPSNGVQGFTTVKYLAPEYA